MQKTKRRVAAKNAKNAKAKSAKKAARFVAVKVQSHMNQIETGTPALGRIDYDSDGNRAIRVIVPHYSRWTIMVSRTRANTLRLGIGCQIYLLSTWKRAIKKVALWHADEHASLDYWHDPACNVISRMTDSWSVEPRYYQSLVNLVAWLELRRDTILKRLGAA